ncbi:MAG: DUF2007 domain-containing protein [Gammaproteobacteria bacterium]|nr:MAG: DUF2007 domain-containing protein [Gammaproteobacteria bacterium]
MKRNFWSDWRNWSLRVRKIYEAENIIDAELLAQMFRAHGVDVFIEGWHRQGALGELPVNAAPTLWVADDVLARAQNVLQLWQQWQTTTQSQADWRCPRCGEMVPATMLNCWSCGQAYTSQIIKSQESARE